jgi:nucleoid-associated protein EbfC
MMPGMPDLGQILLQAQQMQAEMQRAQASLAEAEVTGTAAGGLVTAVVNGSGELLRLRIDPTVVDPSDVETLEDLVIAAVHDARRAAEGVAGSAMSSIAGSLDLSSLGIPGFGSPGPGDPQALELDDGFEDEQDDLEFDDEDEEDEEDEEDGDDRVLVIDETRVDVIDALPVRSSEQGLSDWPVRSSEQGPSEPPTPTGGV